MAASLAMGIWAGGALAQENAPTAVKKTKAEDNGSPLLGPGLQAPEANYTEAEKAELKALEDLVRRFSDSAESYRSSARQLIEYKFSKKRNLLVDYYEDAVVQLEEEQRLNRLQAIEQFEKFVKSHPDGDAYTADAMFRLSELYYERSYDEYLQANDDFEVALESWDPDSGVEEPELPGYEFQPTIAMMQRLITEYPDYRLVDGAYYLLGYCLGEQGEEDGSLNIFEDLVAQVPNSQFSPEVWMRIGEYHFGGSDLEQARDSFQKVLPHYDSAFYDKALYKLAWTHFRLADPIDSPQEFDKSVSYFLELLDFNVKTAAEGAERGSELLKESKQYVAIAYADETWGGLEKMLSLIDGRDDKPYNRDLFSALGSVYFDQTLFDKAVEVFEIIQNRYPDHPEAPKVQEQIMTAFERQRNFEGLAKARDVLTANFSPGGAWFETNKDNLDALIYAEDLSRRSLYAAAVFYHEQAQAYEDSGDFELATETYRRASEGYSDYLGRYPHDKQLYELTYYLADTLYYSQAFDEAVTYFERVRDSGMNDDFVIDSASNAVFAYENGIKVAVMRGDFEEFTIKTSAEREEGVEIVPQPIPERYANLISATDALGRMKPDDENLAGFLYKSAQINLGYDHLDEALTRFQDVLLKYPTNDETASFSVESIVDIYQTKRDYSSVVAFTKQVIDDENFAQLPDLLSSLQGYRTGAQFMVAQELAGSDKHDDASALYVALVDENPTYANADSALNNAAVSFEKNKRFDSAMKMYQRIVDEYPQSPRADASLFRVGVNAQNFFDFDSALKTYQKLVKDYPNSESRADAFYNVAFALEQMQQYKKAARQYLKYCDVFPDRDDAPEVCFRAGEVYEKMDDPKRVLSTYANFIKRYAKNELHRDRVLEAHLRMAKTYEKLGKRRDLKKAREKYETIIEEYNAKPEDKSALYAAEAEFKLLEPDYDKFASFELKGSDEVQQKALLEQMESIKDLGKSYKGILRFKQVEWMLAALYRQANLYQLLMKQMFDSECPPEYKKLAKDMDLYVEDLCDERKVLLEEQAVALEDAAVQQYESVIERSREYQIANKWTKSTLVALNELRKSEWPLQKDAKRYVEPIAFGTPGLVSLDGTNYTPPAPEPVVEAEEPAPEGEATAPEAAAEGEATAPEAAPEGEATAPEAAPEGEATAPEAAPEGEATAPEAAPEGEATAPE
ncbi:MAG: tetratricopeptide repeat protein, partial [Deltaproteobacteria bacterium]|nr:tetratricopeptide repeat protein [Deltaproteobacteria bacterium]